LKVLAGWEKLFRLNYKGEFRSYINLTNTTAAATCYLCALFLNTLPQAILGQVQRGKNVRDSRLILDRHTKASETNLPSVLKLENGSDASSFFMFSASGIMHL
jgi:hypothetical protein